MGADLGHWHTGLWSNGRPRRTCFETGTNWPKNHHQSASMFEDGLNKIMVACSDFCLPKEEQAPEFEEVNLTRHLNWLDVSNLKVTLPSIQLREQISGT